LRRYFGIYGKEEKASIATGYEPSKWQTLGKASHA